jgi:hypothetical protein
MPTRRVYGQTYDEIAVVSADPLLVEGSDGGMRVPPHDYRGFTYNGAGDPTAIVYKVGGSSGTTVATKTFTYDGSANVTSITLTLA